MAVELPTYINEMDPKNPDGKDPIAEGDNHIRNMKQAIKNTFPNVEGEVTSTHEELSELSGLARLPDAPQAEGSMIYSKSGKWIETTDISINDSSGVVTLQTPQVNMTGNLSVAGELDVGSFTVNGAPVFTFGDGLELNGTEVKMSGDYSGTFTAGNVIALSDERKKESIETAPADVIGAIRGTEWVWKESGKKGSGVIAQELEAAGLEHLVHESDDGVKGVNYDGLFAYVIEELKALRAAYERDCN
jgi:hypothetical protein